MEYVEGESISKIISHQGPFDVSYATSIFLQILDGINYAHKHKVVHKDIKTSNFILTPTLAKITDFGIAQIIGDPGLTSQDGGVIGTPKYMSPEMILGKKLDHRTDIYSLGITFFEFLTGEVPFSANGNSDFEIRKAQVELPPPQPTALNPEVSKELEAIILKSLEKNPEDRYQNVEEIIKEIQKLDLNKKDQNSLEVEKQPSSTSNNQIEIEVRKDSNKDQDIKKDFDVSGRLEDTNFAKLLSKFHHERSLGQLHIHSNLELKIYFYNGYIQFVECVDPNLLLGKLLVENKTITVKDQESALEYTNKSGLKIGEALIKLGKITPHDLGSILELQIELKLLNGFRCIEGNYGFEYADQTEVETFFRIDPIQIIYDAVDKHYIYEEILQDNNLNHDGIIKPNKELTEKISELSLSSVQEIKLANILSEKITINEILSESPLDHQDTFKFLKFLDLAQLITIEKNKSSTKKLNKKQKTAILDPLGDKTVILSETDIEEQLNEALKKI